MAQWFQVSGKCSMKVGCHEHSTREQRQKKERQREDDVYCFGAVYFHDGR